MMPIVLDIETSGLDKVNCGIWQIGAIDLNDTKEIFFEESRIDDDDVVEEGALKVIGKTEEELRNKKKQSQKKLLKNFFKWIEKRKLKNFLCQNPQFDVPLLEIRANKYGLMKTFHYRAFDLHTIAQVKYFELNSDFSTREGHSRMSLPGILEFVGMKDERRIIGKGGKIEQEGHPHNALEDSKLTAECFSRLVYGKNLFPEYSKFEIPEVLKK